jgi:hypothetical protein
VSKIDETVGANCEEVEVTEAPRGPRSKPRVGAVVAPAIKPLSYPQFAADFFAAMATSAMQDLRQTDGTPLAHLCLKAYSAYLKSLEIHAAQNPGA